MTLKAGISVSENTTSARKTDTTLFYFIFLRIAILPTSVILDPQRMNVQQHQRNLYIAWKYI